MRNHQLQRGFVFLYIIIIVGAIMVSISIAAALAGGFAGNRIRAYQDGAESRMLLMRCAETVLMQVRTTPTFTGSGSIAAGADSACTYTVTSSAVPKTITIVATDNTLMRRLTITVTQVTPTMLARWVEGS